MPNEPHPIQTNRVNIAQTPVRAHDAITAIRHAATKSLPHSDTTIARVAWSIISEPADIEAAALIHAHGPVAALSIVVNPQQSGSQERLTRLAAVQYNPSRVARRLDLSEVGKFTIVTPEDDRWPTRLAALGDAAPLLLWCNGNPDALNAERGTAITGSRAATSYGEHVTMHIATDLVAAGHTIITGAAYGIDGMATRATLASNGTPVVVLAGGVDRPYPAGHHDLITRVASSTGVVVSELPPTTAPTKWRFLQRNRIIAALGDQLVVVEAGSRSGSLNTAGHANHIGRPVCAIPGPVTSATSAGCHHLIRDGHARLITDAAQID